MNPPVKHKYRHRSKRCSICKSPHCDTVDKMIAEGISGEKIATWLKENDPNVTRNLNRRHISKHNKAHRLPSMQELTFEPEEEIIDTSDDKQAEAYGPVQTMDMVQFLDVIIEKVQKEVIGGELVPTIDNALKAAEIKAKYKQKSPFEGALVNFFMGFGKEHGFYNKEDVEG